jgi:hypothetical protein
MGRRRRVTAETDWAEVERLMLRSFTGSALSEHEQALIRAAYEAHPVEYGERHRKIKDEEIARRRAAF